jgi:hypothetical protein
MPERTIELPGFLGPERTALFPIKREVFIPRTRQAYEEKSFIFFDVDGQERSFFTRKVENWCLPTLIGFESVKTNSYADVYLLAWKILKVRGFTVVSNAWKMSDEKVITTNLIEKGGSVYDRKIDASIEREPLSMDGDFVKIPIAKVQREAEKLVNLANKNGVELMTEDPFHIIIRPDSSWYIMALDIGKVSIHENSKDLDKDMKHDNEYFTERSLSGFAKIQENIKTLRDARGLA